MDARRDHDSRGVLSMSAILGILLPRVAVAQAPAPVADGSGPGGTLVVAGIVVALLLMLGVWVKLYDAKRRRDAEAAHVQARVSDVLAQDPRFRGTAVLATARASVWPRTPLTLVVSGEVPTPGLREAAIHLACAEAARIGSEIRIEDRVMVLPARRAA
jgi:hypothetical protein